MSKMKHSPSAEEIISTLNLVKHCEGGYFYQTHRSNDFFTNDENKNRVYLTSIYYLLTRESSLSYFAQNKSDLVLYHHFGDPIKIIFLQSDGTLTDEILGSGILKGEKPQVICPANTCKAYDLMDGEYALIGEAVSPGFEYDDMHMPSLYELSLKYPDKTKIFEKYCPNILS